ncbi:hypothetical protein U9M48_039741, partial [Paspalum notatum var. saurae]
MVDLALKWCLIQLVGAPLLLLLWGVLPALLLLLPPLRAVVGEILVLLGLLTLLVLLLLVAGVGVAVGGRRVELSFLLFNFLALLLCKQGTVHQDSLLIIALRNVKLSLHCTEPVICLKRISRMGESRRMSLRKVSTPVPLLRLRIGLNILQSLYCIVESSHHLYLKLKRLICYQQ